MKQISLVDYLIIDDGEPYLLAFEAVETGALYLERHNADPKGGGSESKRRKLSRKGVLRSFTVVVRGAVKPFVSAIVDLEGGGRVKANLVGVDLDPSKIELGMPLELTTFGVAKDENGTEAVSFGFRPSA